MASIDALIGALKQYEGTLAFVTHDVHFIRSIAGTVLHIHAGRLTPYAGDYEYYLEKSLAASERDGLVAALHNHQPAETAPAAAPAGPKLGMKEIREMRRAESERRQAAARERREKQKRLAAFEQEIVELEARQKDLTEKLDDPTLYQNTARALDLNRELAGVADALARVNAKWSSLADELAPEPDAPDANS